MAYIKQHIPSFIDGYERETVEFNSLDELFNIKWVKRLKVKPDGQIDPLFHRYSICIERGDTEATLMAEFNDGYTWYVVGFIDDPEIVKDIPTWVGKKK